MKTIYKSNIEVYDNGGQTYDRYAVWCDGHWFGMSHNPDSPQGYNQVISDTYGIIAKGLKLKHLPKAVIKGLQSRGYQITEGNT